MQTTNLHESKSIAVIGIAGRFPGAENPEEFWNNLIEGIDSITEIPSDRWKINDYYSKESKEGTMKTCWGGFLDNKDHFDAEFFGLSSEEANNLDPQHRLLLEMSHEVFENAGISPEQLSGSQTEVWVGITTQDYSQMKRPHPEGKNMYATIEGTAASAANRLSYFYNLKGLSLSLDTMCSSSLLSIHLACQNLTLGVSNLALAGGVNFNLCPINTISLSQVGVLSPDGRCKSFDASGKGYVRSEGGGMVVLKRLNDALNDHDLILATIRGSAASQDGKSNSYLAPNGLAQEEVIRKALEKSQVNPEEISYVETHGTGTRIGDRLEGNALGNVLCKNRPADSPLYLGAVKSNVGHLEAAAGVISLIKTVLALKHGHIPGNLHLKNPNSNVPWEKFNMKLLTHNQPWVSWDGLRKAGINSFGAGGTNVHMIMEEAPSPKFSPKQPEQSTHILTLTARTEATLKELCGKMKNFLTGEKFGETIGDICYSANTGRGHYQQRLALIGKNKADFLQQLEGAKSCKIPKSKAPSVVFLFPGQGSQYCEMGHMLYDTQPVFRKILDRLDQIFQIYRNHSLLSVLWGDASEKLDQTEFTQPALFLLEYALFQLWEKWGVKPTAVIGHSLGEYVAACCAGVFSLEDGMRLVEGRSRLMQLLPSGGGMLAVFASESRVREQIQPFAGFFLIRKMLKVLLIP